MPIRSFSQETLMLWIKRVIRCIITEKEGKTKITSEFAYYLLSGLGTTLILSGVIEFKFSFADITLNVVRLFF